MRVQSISVFLCFAFLVPGPPKIQQEFAAKMIGITDGDTITVLVGREQIKIRLEGIDAPEKNQAFGSQSKSALSKLISQKTLIVKVTDTDRYGRLIARIDAGGLDVNAAMIKLGMAWHYKEYSDEELLARLEVLARGSRVGLWAESNALPPWEFRARQKSKGSAEAPSAFVDNSQSQGSSPPVASAGSHWLNTSGGVRHNSSCQYFQNTKRGRLCGPTDGKACGKCGG